MLSYSRSNENEALDRERGSCTIVATKIACLFLLRVQEYRTLLLQLNRYKISVVEMLIAEEICA